MNPERKKYILENAGRKSPAQIASELGIRERNVKKIIQLEREKGRSESAAVAPAAPKAAAPPGSKKFALASIALIIVLGAAVYFNSLNGKFLFDDDNLITNNAFIKEGNLLSKVFGADIGTGASARYSFYRPIQMLTYALDYRIWGLNVIGYHLTNILLHILVALCVWYLIDILFENKPLSLLTALFFVTHPVHTTVVSYISTRAESLCLLFMLVSFIFYIKASKTDSMISYLIMVSSYLLSLLSKENALTLPVLLLLYHYTFRQKVRMREFLSISGAAAFYIFLRMTALKHLIAGVVDRGTVLQRIPGFFIAVAEYFRLMLLPFGLHIEYGEKLFSPADPRAIAGLAILICLSYFIFKTAKARSLLFFSLSWFLISLLPVSNLYPLNAYMSESWLYLPSIGLFLLLAGLLGRLYKSRMWRVWALALTGLILAFYSCLTIMQNRIWAEPIAFYERTLKFAPDSTKTYNNLGTAYYKAGRKEEAVACYEKAIKYNPDNLGAYNNLALVHNDSGKKEKAIAIYEKTTKLDPHNANTYNNLGVIYYSMDKKEEARRSYKRALEINPYHPDARRNLALMEAETSQDLSSLRKFVEANPLDAEARNNLGIACYKAGEKEESISSFRKAIGLEPGYAASYNNLANVLYTNADNKSKEEAIALYRKAIELNPNYADAYKNLGVAYLKMDRREEAIAAFKKALETNPDHADARRNLEAAEKGL